MSDTMEKFINHKMVLVESSTTVLEAYNLMKKNNIRHLPVVKEGMAIGVVSDRDVQFINFGGDSLNLKVEDIMTKEPLTVDSLTTIPHVVQLMKNKKVNSVLINGSNKKIEGIFTSTDALNILFETYKI
jgi:predicted transcriptional regulator